MDRKSLQKKLEQLDLRGLGVQISPLNSASAEWLLLVPPEGLLRVAKLLAESPGLDFNCCENFSVFERGSFFTLSYFLRSDKNKLNVILRVNLPAVQGSLPVEFLSVASVWPMILPWEVENSLLFGIQCRGNEAMIRSSGLEVNLLPEGLSGFPLRKSFRVFKNADPVVAAVQERSES